MRTCNQEEGDVGGSVGLWVRGEVGGEVVGRLVGFLVAKSCRRMSEVCSESGGG